MRDATGDQARGVCAVDADVATARPVGQRRGAGVCPECDGAVKRIVETGQLEAYIELARRRRRRPCTDTHRSLEDLLVSAVERRRKSHLVDYEARVEEGVPTEG